MNIDFNWLQVWERKGKESTEDFMILDGYDLTEINLEKSAIDIIEKMNIKPEDKVLEIGCGAGGIARFLNCDYVGIDYSKTLVKKHIELLKNSVLCAEANNLPFKDKYFDKVICYGVFLYFPNQYYAKQVIYEMKRVAKKSIYIGDLPITSHRREHQLYKKEDFKEWEIFDAHYYKDRFNAMYIIK